MKLRSEYPDTRAYYASPRNTIAAAGSSIMPKIANTNRLYSAVVGGRRKRRPSPPAATASE